MKIAILHNDWLEYGGSEKVAIDITKSLDTGNIIYVRKSSKHAKEIAENHGITIKVIKGIFKSPLNRVINNFIQIISYNDINIREFDSEVKVIITTGEYAKNIIPQQDLFHLHYCHSPLRPLYDLRHYSIGQRRSLIFRNRFLSSIIKFPLYPYELSFYSKIDKVVANSLNTQMRLKKYLNINSEVLYPAINTIKYKFIDKKNFFLSVQRLVREKRIEEQIEAFNILGLPLYIVGEGHLYKYLKKISKKNIIFCGFIPDNDLFELYGSCRAFIVTAENEDFGLTPLEAMASGKPVIAVNEGGFKETIIDGKTGILFERGKLVEAINNFIKNENNFDVDVIKNHAAKFDISIFQKKLKNIISKYMNSSL